MASIPASAIVSVTPSVLSAGGSALDLNGVILTGNTRVPAGQVVSLSSADDVSAYFGPSSDEYTAAQVYFLGFENSTKKPGELLFSLYSTAAVAPFLRGGNVSALGLDAVKAMTGVLTVTMAGTPKTSSTINLSAATSFSNAASLIQAAFTTPGFTVTFDSVSGGIVFTSSTAGADVTVSYASGTLAAPLLLTQATGAVRSFGSAAMTPGSAMDALKASTQNWATFTTLANPDVSGSVNKLAFAAWSNAQNNRYLYVVWDNDASATTSSAATGSLGYILKLNEYSGVMPVWAPGNDKAVFTMGAIASIDFEETNGRTTLAFRRQSGLAPDVTNQTVAANLIANGYNYYGAYATANDNFVFMYPGQMPGQFLWADSFIGQVQFNNALQLSQISLLVNAKSVPYNEAGRSLIRAAAMDPINAALNFGTIRTGVALSAAQAAQVNGDAGVRISDTLSSAGWYLQVRDATAQVRAARGSPPIKLWYMDGQSVQQININSILVQ